MIVECPHCHTRVLPMANYICPACRGDISDISDVDPNVVSIIVRESDELPPYCHSCNSSTERSVKIKGEEESDLTRVFLALAGIFFFRPKWALEEETNTPNVIIYFPQCDECAQFGKPAPIQVDFENQTMTFLVHPGFRDRIYPRQGIETGSAYEIDEEKTD